MPRHAIIQRLFVAIILIAVAAAIARLFALRGLVFPVRVTSGSMATWLLGEHFWCECGECNYSFAFGVESKPRDEFAVCPNCGWNKNPVRSELRRRGNQVLIDRAEFWFDRPERFDPVAFYDPADPARLVVKRIIGLPGERIAIRNGELFIDDKLVQKSLEQFRKTAVVVHDNRYLAKHAGEMQYRWKPERDRTSWQSGGETMHWIPPRKKIEATANEGESRGEDWLVYSHWRCYASSYPRFATVPISDNSGYNQGESRVLQSVTDFVLSCELETQGAARVSFRIHDGQTWHQVVLSPPPRRAEVWRGDDLVARVNLPPGSNSQPFHLEYGILDQQVVLGVNSIEVVRAAYKPDSASSTPISQPLGILGEEGAVSISRLIIQRDVYYLDPANVGQAWEGGKSTSGGYLVLGDNPSLSEDSRHWRVRFVPGSEIRGKVIRWR